MAAVFPTKSYLTARPSRDLIIAAHQQIAYDWWHTRRTNYELCVSELVLDESGAGDAQAAEERLLVLQPLLVIETTTEAFDGGEAMSDPIVDEVRRIRDAHAALFNYDLRAIFLDIKKRENERGLEFIDGVARQPMPNQTLQPTGAAIPASQDSKSLKAAPAAEL